MKKGEGQLTASARLGSSQAALGFGSTFLALDLGGTNL